MNRKFDYDMIERDYISGEMGLRELARMHGINNHSLITYQSKKRDWVRKREDFRSKAADKAVTLMATAEGRRLAREEQVRDNAIDAIDEAITKMRSDMTKTRMVMRNGEYVEEPMVVIRPQDLAVLIDRLNVLFGRPSSISEDRNLGVSFSASGAVGPELLRSIVEATRGIVPESSGRSPIPRLGDPREN